MFGLHNHKKVEHTGVQFGVVAVLNHVQEVLGYTQIFLWMAYVKASSLNTVPVDVVGIGNDGREFCYEFDALSHQIVT